MAIFICEKAVFFIFALVQTGEGARSGWIWRLRGVRRRRGVGRMGVGGRGGVMHFGVGR